MIRSGDCRHGAFGHWRRGTVSILLAGLYTRRRDYLALTQAELRRRPKVDDAGGTGLSERRTSLDCENTWPSRRLPVDMSGSIEFAGICKSSVRPTISPTDCSLSVGNPKLRNGGWSFSNRCFSQSGHRPNLAQWRSKSASGAFPESCRAGAWKPRRRL